MLLVASFSYISYVVRYMTFNVVCCMTFNVVCCMTFNVVSCMCSYLIFNFILVNIRCPNCTVHVFISKHF